ncbi:MAG: DUF481 domain-containing protein [Mucilaginibacter sp.]
MKQLLAFIFILFCANAASAQFNDSTFYHSTITSTGSINKTNNGRSNLLNNVFNFGIKKKDIVLNTTNSFVYGNQNGVLTNRDFSSALDFNLYKSFHRFYYWGLLNYNTSYSLKINNEFLGGLGVAYRIVDNKNALISLSNGVLYDKSLLLGGYLNYSTYRNSFKLNFHFDINDLVIVDGNNVLQNSLNNSNDYIIQSATTVSVKLRKWIRLSSSLNYNKMNITSSQNMLITYGLTFDKYF